MLTFALKIISQIKKIPLVKKMSMEQWVKQAASSSHKIGHTPLNVCGEPKNYPEYGNFKKT
jgi:hypothetical protein